VEQLFEVLKRVTSALRSAGIEYRVVGGVATFLHVSEKDPLAARMTRDIDMAVDRLDLDRIADAVRPFGFEYRQTAGGDMLVDAAKPRARSAVHLVMVREKVRPEYPEAAPDFSPPVETREGVLLAPVVDLVRMKLTSYRLKDRVHIQDMDAAGLITAEIEGCLPDELRRRLAEIRSTR
jgi:signal recognition particle subunit SEC65